MNQPLLFLTFSHKIEPFSMPPTTWIWFYLKCLINDKNGTLIKSKWDYYPNRLINVSILFSPSDFLWKKLAKLRLPIFISSFGRIALSFLNICFLELDPWQCINIKTVETEYIAGAEISVIPPIFWNKYWNLVWLKCHSSDLKPMILYRLGFFSFSFVLFFVSNSQNSPSWILRVSAHRHLHFTQYKKRKLSWKESCPGRCNFTAH